MRPGESRCFYPCSGPLPQSAASAPLKSYIACQVLFRGRKSAVLCPLTFRRLYPDDSRHRTAICPVLISLSTIRSMSSIPPEKLQQILDSPAWRPPNGSVAILDNPPNDNKLAVAVIATCLILATAFSVLRVYSRVFCAGKVRIEDCKYHRLLFCAPVNLAR